VLGTVLSVVKLDGCEIAGDECAGNVADGVVDGQELWMVQRRGCSFEPTTLTPTKHMTEGTSSAKKEKSSAPREASARSVRGRPAKYAR
jgi:hypothetical protein